MKILSLDWRANYFNPTTTALRQVLQRIGDVTYFGPGFNSEEVLKKGLKNFYNEEGPFDFVIGNEFMLEQCTAENIKVYKRNYLLKFPSYLIRYFENVFEEYVALDARKVITLMAYDFYGATTEFCDKIEKSNAYIVSWGRELIARFSELTETDLEYFKIAPSANQGWIDLIEKVPERVISIPHFVKVPNKVKPICNRKYDWAFPGAEYYYRRKAKSEILSKNMYEKGMRYFHALCGKVNFNLYNNRLGLNLLQGIFDQVIKNSKYCYTDGSRLRYAIRKYFEIPALGSVLVADPCVGFANLGFVHEKNCIVAEGGSVVGANQLLQGDQRFAQEIAQKGHELVHQTHSIPARVEQLKSALSRIQAGSFKGSVWDKGKFILK